MYWECTDCFEEENGSVQRTGVDYYIEFSVSKIADSLEAAAQTELPTAGDAWYRMVQDYTSRNLTYLSDKLPASSGVIAALQNLTGDVCYAGIWKSWFLKGLLWRVQDPKLDLYVFASKQATRPDFYRAPSWSFASIEGVIVHDEFQYAADFNYCAQLVDVAVTPKGGNPLGELESGYARIKAPLTILKMTEQDRFGADTIGRSCVVRLKNGRFAHASVYFDGPRYETCQVLMVTTSAGLAVQAVEERENTYVRVGAVLIYARMPLADEFGYPKTYELLKTALLPSAYTEPTLVTLL